MPQVRATLPERYALSLLIGTGVTFLLFVVSVLSFVALFFVGEPDFFSWFLAGTFVIVSAWAGVALGILWHHDRALVRNPQKYVEGNPA